MKGYRLNYCLGPVSQPKRRETDQHRYRSHRGHYAYIDDPRVWNPCEIPRWQPRGRLSFPNAAVVLDIPRRKETAVRVPMRGKAGKYHLP
jgi:hypothetical protein